MEEATARHEQEEAYVPGCLGMPSAMQAVHICEQGCETAPSQGHGRRVPYVENILRAVQTARQRLSSQGDTMTRSSC